MQCKFFDEINEKALSHRLECLEGQPQQQPPPQLRLQPLQPKRNQFTHIYSLLNPSPFHQQVLTFSSDTF